MGKTERLSVRMSSALLKELDHYIGELHIESFSQAIEVFLISFVMNSNIYPEVNDPILLEDKMVTKSFSVSSKASTQIREIAKQSNVSVGECIRLAIYYGVRTK